MVSNQKRYTKPLLLVGVTFLKNLANGETAVCDLNALWEGWV